MIRIFLSVVDYNVSEVMSNNAIFKCMDCELTKTTRRTQVAFKKYFRKEKDGFLKKDILQPGAMVSTEQFVSDLPERLLNTYGCEKQSQ